MVSYLSNLPASMFSLSFSFLTSPTPNQSLWYQPCFTKAKKAYIYFNIYYILKKAKLTIILSAPCYSIANVMLMNDIVSTLIPGKVNITSRGRVESVFHDSST